MSDLAAAAALAGLALCTGAASITAQESAARPVAWLQDLQQAAGLAAESGRDILIAFTASTWSRPCELLRDEVFDDERFAAAAEQFVCVEVDFPRDPRTVAPDVVVRCEELQLRYAVDGLPTVLLLDPELRGFAECEVQAPDPAAWLARLTELRDVRRRRDAHLALAENSVGLERARHLAAAIDEVPERLHRDYRQWIEQVVELAPDGADGLRERFTARLDAVRLADRRVAATRRMRDTLRDIEPLVQGGRFGDAAERLKVLLDADREALVVDQRLQVTLLRGSFLERAGALDEALAVYREARALRPDDPRLGGVDARIDELQREVDRDARR